MLIPSSDWVPTAAAAASCCLSMTNTLCTMVYYDNIIYSATLQSPAMYIQRQPGTTWLCVLQAQIICVSHRRWLTERWLTESASVQVCKICRYLRIYADVYARSGYLGIWYMVVMACSATGLWLNHGERRKGNGLYVGERISTTAAAHPQPVQSCLGGRARARELHQSPPTRAILCSIHKTQNITTYIFINI